MYEGLRTILVLDHYLTDAALRKKWQLLVTREYDLLQIRVGRKEPPRPGSTMCYA